MKPDPLNSYLTFRIGRLFATLEKIHNEANPGDDAAFRNLHFSIASSRPSSVFENLINQAKDQLPKIQDAELRAYLEKLFIDVVEYTRTFPAMLTPADLEMFTAGYYRQIEDISNRIIQ
jgi:CRISPR-associated protein Csd1